MTHAHPDLSAFSNIPSYDNPFSPRASNEAETGYALIKRGEPLRPGECELLHTQALEVMLLWGSTVLAVRHFAPPRNIFLVATESKEDAEFLLPELTVGAEKIPLVVVEPDQARLLVPARATARSAQGEVHPAGSSLVLVSGDHVSVELDRFTLRVAAVAAGKPVARMLLEQEDRSSAIYFGFSALAQIGIIAAMAWFAPPLGLTEDDGIDQERLVTIRQYLSASAEREREEQNRATEEQGDVRTPSDGASQAAPGESGKLGRNTDEKRGRLAVRRIDPNAPMSPSRERMIREAANFGTTGLLNSGIASPMSAPWGGPIANGADDRDAMGDMWSDDIGDVSGTGWGVSGIGEGAGGRGTGIGIDGVGTCTGGLCAGMQGGFGRSLARLQPNHKPRVPQVRSGITTTSGRLPAEVIQRVVRQNFGRFRLCYEQGLMKNPNLEGRVAVRFVIGRDGQVSHTSNGGSDLPDSGVVSCVISAYYGLSFPAPENGIVTVVYPIAFSPG